MHKIQMIECSFLFQCFFVFGERIYTRAHGNAVYEASVSMFALGKIIFPLYVAHCRKQLRSTGSV